MSSRMIAHIVQVAIVAACLATPASADDADRCAADRAVKVCIDSAAVTGSPNVMHRGGARVLVSVVLTIENLTDYPIDAALLGDTNRWSLTPENSESIAPCTFIGCGPDFSGIGACYGSGSCQYTTFPPNLPMHIQVSFGSGVSANSLPLMRLATKAFLSATLAVVERGRTRKVPLSIGKFSFGNGLSSLR